MIHVEHPGTRRTLCSLALPSLAAGHVYIRAHQVELLALASPGKSCSVCFDHMGLLGCGK